MLAQMHNLLTMRAVVFLCLPLTLDALAAPADELREFIRWEKERLEIPGVSVALIDEGSVEYITVGVRRADDSGEVTRVDTFDIGSIGKPVTAWAVMRLAEQGLVSLDAPVEEYINQRWEFPDTEFDSALVTLRRILSHTAGLSAPSYQGFPAGTAPLSLEESLDGIPVRSSAVRIIVEPGTEYRYSGGGFAVAQLVIESVTGRSFPEFMRSELFEPLGMESAEYLTFDREPLPVSPHDHAGRPITDYRLIEHGAGGLRASAEDMVDFLMANMAPNPVLAESTVSGMHEPLEIRDGDANRTLGFARREGLLSHGGDNRGWVAQIDFQPTSQSGLVVLTNSANGRRLTQSVRCKWSELFDIDGLVAHCERQRLTDRVTHWTIVAASAAALILAVWIAWRNYRDFRNGSTQASLSVATAVRSSFYILSIGIIWIALGTELGAYLASGISWGLPTIGFLPVATPYAATASTVLLGVLACTSFLRRDPA